MSAPELLSTNTTPHNVTNIKHRNCNAKCYKLFHEQLSYPAVNDISLLNDKIVTLGVTIALTLMKQAIMYTINR